MMRATLKRLRDAADDLNDGEKLTAAARVVWGPEATERTAREFFARWHRLAPIGRALAEQVVVYGTFRPFTRDELDALDIAQPYAYALRVRLRADSETIARGGIGDVTFYSTMTDGDMKAAERLRHEALARSRLQ